MSEEIATPRRATIMALLLFLLAISTAEPSQAAEFLDPSFGEGGISFPGDRGSVRDLAQDADGKMVGIGGPSGMRVSRYLNNGALDVRFGRDDGRTPAEGFGSRGNAVAVQPDGRILAAGATLSGNFLLARYKSDGSRRDPTFGEKDGYTVTLAGSYGGGAQDIAVKRDGRILTAGYEIDFHHKWAAMLAAYRPNGTLDRRFSRDGIVRLRPKARGEVPIRLVAVKALRSGRILAAGELNGRIMVLALRPDGRPDRRFGGGDGILFTDADGSRRCPCAYATDMELDRRGRIVVAANITGPRPREHAALIRYRPNGRLDRSFGRRGISRAVLGSRLAGKDLAIQHNGQMVLAGTYNVPQTGEARIAVVRFLSRGALDRSFARRGFFIRDFGAEGVAYAALTQRDGRIVVGGRINPEPSPFQEDPSIYDTAEVFLMRFLP
jgi:uncharacterized delta-60 repeat protein